MRSLSGPDVLSGSVSAEAADWLLGQLRERSGVGSGWHHLLVLAPGLSLTLPPGLTEAALAEVSDQRGPDKLGPGQLIDSWMAMSSVAALLADESWRGVHRA